MGYVPPSVYAVKLVERATPLDGSDDAVFAAWCASTDSRTLWEFCTTEYVRESTLTGRIERLPPPAPPARRYSEYEQRLRVAARLPLLGTDSTGTR